MQACGVGGEYIGGAWRAPVSIGVLSMIIEEIGPLRSRRRILFANPRRGAVNKYKWRVIEEAQNIAGRCYLDWQALAMRMLVTAREADEPSAFAAASFSPSRASLARGAGIGERAFINVGVWPKSPCRAVMPAASPRNVEQRLRISSAMPSLSADP